MTSEQRAPLAFSGSRLGWTDLPRPVRARIAELAGAAVVSETSATSGFSPGYAALLELGDGTDVFVKAVSPEQNPESPDLARAEIRVAERLPHGVSAPQLVWSHDDGSWVLLGFAPVEGRAPQTPWEPQALELVLRALVDLVEAGTPSPEGLRPLTEDVADLAMGWRHLAEDTPGWERAITCTGRHGEWLSTHLDELVAWADDATTACAGRSLVHGDLRADNVMIDPRNQVWLIDWPHAAGQGAAWFDLLTMLPSVAMQSGGDPAEIFWNHPNAADAEPEAVRAVLAGITGYFVHGAVRPPPRGIGNLRAFQQAQGIAALDWLRRF